MYGGELLQTSHSPKPEHSAFSSPEGEMGILGPIVHMATDLLAVFISNLFHCGAIRRASICDDDLRIPVSFHCFLQEFQGSSLVAFLGDEAFQHFALMIDGTPEIVGFAPYLHEHLVEVPLPLVDLTHIVGPLLADFLGEMRAEPINPEPDAFVTNVHAPLMEQVLDIPQR